MAVYEGVLQKISGGKVISSEGRGGYFTHNMGITRYHKGVVDSQAGFTRREFVDIGGTRIRSVMLTPYYDELMQEALGQEVALSMTGPRPSSGRRHTVVAIRTPNGGVNRPSRKLLLTGSIFLVLKGWLGALIAIVFMFVLAGVAYAINSRLGYLVGALALAAFVWLLVSPVFAAARTFRAAGAL